MTVKEFEKRFFEVEKIKIVVRAASGAQCDYEYPYARMLSGTSKLPALKDRLRGFPYEYEFVKGDIVFHGNSLISSVR